MKFQKRLKKSLAMLVIGSMAFAQLAGAAELPVVPEQQGETEPGLNASFDRLEGISKGDQGRIIIENSNVVIDHFEAKTTEDGKLVIDQYGNVSIAPGYVPSTQETVTVTADVHLYNENDVLFFESFDNSVLDASWNTDEKYYSIISGKGFSGNSALTKTGANGATDGHQVQTNGEDVVLTGWYYDEYSDRGLPETGNAIQFAFGPQKSGVNVIGVSTGEANLGKRDYYAVRLNNGNWQTSDTKRSQGWHKFQFKIGQAGTSYWIDEQQVQSNGVNIVNNSVTAANFNQITLGLNWTKNGHTEHVIGKHFIDDISVVKADAALVSAQVNVTVQLNPMEYTIDPGSATVAHGTTNDLVINVEPNVVGFSSLQLNGEALGSSSYAVDSAAGTVTIFAAYLNTLSEGMYSFDLLFGDLSYRFELSKLSELQAVTGLVWSGTEAVWEPHVDAKAYTLQIFKEDQMLKEVPSAKASYELAELIQEYKEGNYSFLVTAVTGDGLQTPASERSIVKKFAVEIGTQPKFQILESPGTVTFTVTASSANQGELSYQWYEVQKEAGSVPVKIEGATESSYTLQADLSHNGNSYYSVLTDGVSVETNKALLLVGDASAEFRFDPQSAVTLGEANGVDATADFNSSLANYDYWHAFILHKNDEPLQAYVAKTQKSQFNLLEHMKENGAGAYQISIVTLGAEHEGKSYVNSMESQLSNEIIIEQLEKPLAAGWRGKTASWSKIEQANGYELQLYLNEQPVGEAVLVGANELSYTFSLADGAAYQYTVRAIANPKKRFIDSEPSAASAAYEVEAVTVTLDSPELVKGIQEKLYIDGGADYAFDDVEFRVNEEDQHKVVIDQDGNISIKPEYLPNEQSGDFVTVQAEVSYYEGADVLFKDNFEEGKLFTVGAAGASDSYKISDLQSRFGRSAATAVSGKSGPTRVILPNDTGNPIHGKVTVWFYDAGDMNQLIKLAFSVQNAATSNSTSAFYALGVVQDSGDTNRYGKYIWRAGSDWKATDGSAAGTEAINRVKGWNKLEWDVTAGGTTAYINGKKAFETAAVKDIGALVMLTNWNQNAGNIQDRYFFDDVSVIAPNAAKKTMTVTQQIKLAGKRYLFDPATASFDLANPKDVRITVKPDQADLASIVVNGQVWQKGQDYTLEGSSELILLAQGKIQTLTKGIHELRIIFSEGGEKQLLLDVQSNEPRKYYVSNQSGDDAHDGLTPATAWKSLEKLNQLVFNPGDEILLDAESIWNGQLKLKGSGTVNKVIKLGKYNDNGQRHKRPVINGGGTKSVDVYYMLDTNPPEKRTASGAVELVNEEYWEIDGLEVTNLGENWEIGRSGIMIMNNYADSLEDRTAENFNKSKKNHIYVTNSYVHDVNALHQHFGGTKVAGGIIFYGYIDDILAEGNTTVRTDNEGIRNSGFHPNGWSSSGYPAIMKVRFLNNYMANGSGDAMVLSNALNGEVRYNYVTGFGKTYLTDFKTNGDGPNITSGSGRYVSQANYAALWFMGVKDSVMEFNEVVDNPYNCADGEAFDIDSFSDGAVYQYNYSRNNYGGFMLFMPASKNSIVRYNISIDDGSPQEGSAALAHLFYYAVGGSASSNAYPIIHNNIFKLGKDTTRIFGTGDKGTIWTHFYNNIIYGKDAIQVFDLNSTSKMTHGGFDYNLIYPNTLLDQSRFAQGVYGEHNIYADPKDVLVDIEQSLDFDIIPKETITARGTVIENGLENKVLHNNRNTGVGRAISEAVFDVSKLAGFKLKQAENNPAIQAGVRADELAAQLPGHRDMREIFPLTRDFFGNAILPGDILDIGVHQIGNEGLVSVEFRAEGAEAGIPYQTVRLGGKVTRPANDPVRDGYRFAGWYEDVAYSKQWNFATDTVSEHLVLYAKWELIENGGVITSPGTGADLGEKIQIMTSVNYAEAELTVNSITVQNGTMQIMISEQQINRALELAAAEQSGNLPLRLAIRIAGTAEVSGVEAVFAKDALARMLQGAHASRLEAVTLYAPAATVMLDKQDLQALMEQMNANSSKANQLKIVVTKEKGNHSSLSTYASFVVRAFIGDKDVTGSIKQATILIPFVLPAGQLESHAVAGSIDQNGIFKPVLASYYDKDRQAMIMQTNDLLPQMAVMIQRAEFADVSGWAQPYIEFLAARNVVAGKGSQLFAPEAPVTRAEFVQMLMKISDGLSVQQAEGEEAPKFADVAENAWYYPALQQAASMGIVSGYNGNFNPQDRISREDMAVMLHRLLGKTTWQFTVAAGNSALPSFNDEQQIAEYAKDAVKAMQLSGIIAGKGEGIFAPKDNAKRAESAKMITQILQKYAGQSLN